MAWEPRARAETNDLVDEGRRMTTGEGGWIKGPKEDKAYKADQEDRIRMVYAAFMSMEPGCDQATSPLRPPA